MRLSKKFLESGSLNSSIPLQTPPADIFGYPEKVLQFGTGVLQRGLCDFYIDKANRAGIFKGRVVVVKSTSKGGADAFDEQDGLYTHCIKGIEDGVAKEENIINSSISRTITASKDWDKIIECAKSEEMQIILSNTTEVGITYLANDPIANGCPNSFPAKLLAFLHARFTHFAGSAASGMVIVPKAVENQICYGQSQEDHTAPTV